MAIYQVKWFKRFSRKNGLSDDALATAAREVEAGNADADLGGGLFKQRVARQGGGKSGGYRTLITHRSSAHFFFVFGFDKGSKDNISDDEEKALKAQAKVLGSLDDAQIQKAIKAGALFEVVENEDEEDE